MRLETSGEAPQRGIGFRRQGQHVRPARPPLRSRFRRLLQYDVGVGPAESEGTDARNPRPPHSAPAAFAVGHRNRQGLPVNQRIGIPEMELGRNRPVPERQDHLDDAGNPGGRLEMAQVGLDRPDDQRIVRGPPLAERRVQSAHLDRIAQRGARAVGLDIAHPEGVYARVLERLHDELLLGQLVRNGKAAGGAVVVNRRSPDQGQNPVPVP